MKKTISTRKNKTKANATSLKSSTIGTAHDAASAVSKASAAMGRVGGNFIDSAGSSIRQGAGATKRALGDAATAASQGARTSVAVAKRRSAATVGTSVKAAAGATGQALSGAAKATKRTAVTVATTVLDQNGDGKLDQEDVKLLTEKSLALAKAGGKEAMRAAQFKQKVGTPGMTALVENCYMATWLHGTKPGAAVCKQSVSVENKKTMLFIQ